MSDKELVLDVIQRMPKSVTMTEIRDRVEFLAAIKAGEESLDRGEGIPHAEVEKQFAGWAKKGVQNHLVATGAQRHEL